MRAWIAVLLAWLCFGGSALAEKRLALVIGNNSYQHIDRLQKARADAKSYADLLREKGFAVEDRYDLGHDEMQGAVAEFVEKIEPGDTAVFVYSGHGWSDGAHNYLVGVDAPERASQERLTRLSLPIRNGLTGVLDDFERKGAGLKVAIIDACRDNPFQPPPGQKGYGLVRGLRPEGVEGSFVVYSAGEGQSAMDRLSEADADPNSVFTRAFLPLLRADLPLLDAVKISQERVYALARTADHDQTPAYYDEVRGRACLSRECKSERQSGPGPDEIAWSFIEKSSEAMLFKNFIAQFPTSRFRETAEKRLAEFERLAALPPTPAAQDPCLSLAQPDATKEQILASQLGATLQACVRAIAENPDDTRFAKMLRMVQEQKGFQEAIGSSDPAASRTYLKSFPDGKFRKEVSAHLAALGTPNPPRATPLVPPRPVACKAGTFLRDGQCEPKTCPSGFILGSDGGCQRIAALPPPILLPSTPITPVEVKPSRPNIRKLPERLHLGGAVDPAVVAAPKPRANIARKHHNGGGGCQTFDHTAFC